MRDAFLPTGPAVSLDVTGTSGFKALPPGCGYVLFTNVLLKACYILFGNGTVASTATTGFALMPATSIVVRIPEGCDQIAAICGGSDTTTLNIQPGAA